MLSDPVCPIANLDGSVRCHRSLKRVQWMCAVCVCVCVCMHLGWRCCCFLLDRQGSTQAPLCTVATTLCGCCCWDSDVCCCNALDNAIIQSSPVCCCHSRITQSCTLHRQTQAPVLLPLLLRKLCCRCCRARCGCRCCCARCGCLRAARVALFPNTRYSGRQQSST